ncbi:MAG: hypothetical protein ACR2QE_11960 [Acidimicrobiales bacterium]
MLGPRRAPTILALLVLVLLAGSCSDSNPGSKALEPVVPSTDSLPPGVEPIRLGVIVPDYTDLIPTGDVPRLTPDFYADRWRAEAAALDAAEAMGPWSARFQVIRWNPVAGADAVCREIATNSAALFLSAVRLPAAVHECLTADERLAITLSPSPDEFSILPRTASFARAAVAQLVDEQLLAGPVAIITGDDPVGALAAQATERALAERNITTASLSVPSSRGVQAVRDAVPALSRALVDTRPGTVLFAANTTIAVELGDTLLAGPWRTIGIDVDGLTDHWASGRLPTAWRGVTAITSLAPTTINESEFERECRTAFELFASGEQVRQPRADWPISVGRQAYSTRGAIDGSQSPPADIGYHECTIMRSLAVALAAVQPPYDTASGRRALAEAGSHPVARARQGDFATNDVLAHHTLIVELRPPSDGACATSGQQCWSTASSDRSGMVPFG